jgi:hypothetical protein
MNSRSRITVIALCLGAGLLMASRSLWAQTPDADNPSPELVGKLTKDLSITPKQATGGAGALFGLAKTRLKADQFSQVAGAVPGMDGLLKAAPKPEKQKGGLSLPGSLGSLGSPVPGGAGGLGGLASLAGPFKSLGLSPDMIGKFVPVLTQFVDAKGGSSVSKLLAGALK